MKETPDELGETCEYLDDDRYVIEDYLRDPEIEKRIKEVIWDLLEEYEEEKAA